MKKSYCIFLTISALLLLVPGCAIKKYTTPDEFFILQPAEQQELCKEWKDILVKQTTDTTYYLAEPWRASSSDHLNLSSAQLGNAIGVMIDNKNKRRAAYNISYCAERHYSDDVPEGYSLYYADKSKKIVFVRSEADELNMKATQSAFNGDLNKAVELTSEALKIQKNLYSYQIRASVYALLEREESNERQKRNLLAKIVEDTTYVISTYNPNGNDYFLRGYAYYFLGRYDKAMNDFNFAFDHFTKLGGFIVKFHYVPETYLYRSRIHCMDKDYEKGLKDVDSGKRFVEVFVSVLNMVELTDSEKKLSDSINETEEICNDKTSKEVIAGGSKLRIGPGRVLEYLDHVNFRGY